MPHRNSKAPPPIRNRPLPPTVPPPRPFTSPRSPQIRIAVTAGALIFWCTCILMKRANGSKTSRLKDYLIAFASPLLVLSIAYHLGHNFTHIVYEITKIIAIASDPLGLHWDLFGTVDAPATMLISGRHCAWIQVLIVSVGSVMALVQVRGVGRQMYSRGQTTQQVSRPMVLMVSLLTVFALGMLMQPMVMMTSV